MDDQSKHLDSIKNELQRSLKSIFIIVPIAFSIAATIYFFNGLTILPIILILGSLINSLIAIHFLSHQQTTTAVMIFCTLIAILVTYRCMAGNGVNEVALVVYPMIILFATFTFSNKGIFYITAIVILGVATVIFGEMLGIYDKSLSETGLYQDVIILLIILSVNIYMLFNFSKISRKVLKRSLLEVENQKLLQKAIEKSIEQQQLILGEIHHRVKNNLTFINSLLEIEPAKSSSDETGKSHKEIQDSIQLIAKVYDPIFQSQKYKFINLKEYLNGMISDFIQSYKMDESNVRVYANNILLKNELMIPMGLMFIELLKAITKNKTRTEIHLFQKYDSLLLNVIFLDASINLEEAIHELLLKNIKNLHGEFSVKENSMKITIPLQSDQSILVY